MSKKTRTGGTKTSPRRRTSYTARAERKNARERERDERERKDEIVRERKCLEQN